MQELPQETAHHIPGTKHSLMELEYRETGYVGWGNGWRGADGAPNAALGICMVNYLGTL